MFWRLPPPISDQVCANGLAAPMDVRADRTSAGPSRALSAEGAASSRGTGRKASDIKSGFPEVQGTGSICKHCENMVKNKQHNGTLMATHLYSCRACLLAVRLKAWNACSTLQMTKPRPMDPHASHPTSGGSASGSAGAAGSRASGPTPAEASSDARSVGVLKFFDRGTSEQAGAIDKAVLRFLSPAACRSLWRKAPPFWKCSTPYGRAMLRGRWCPVGGSWLALSLTSFTENYVMQSLSLWGERRKAVLVLDALENVRHDHILNLLALVNDKPIFLDSVYCGDESQSAENQALLVQEKLNKYGGMSNFNALGTENTASCLEMRRLVAERNPGMVSLNDQGHVSNLLIGDICEETWGKGVIERPLAVSSYVRGHQRLLAA